MRMGLEQDGWRVVWANDIDEKKQQMYLGHYGRNHGQFILGDVHKIDPNTIPEVELATASFPCNDLSLAGARRGLSGQHSSAFWGFINVLEGMMKRRPPIVMLENVTGFLTSHEGNDFLESCQALNDLGYSVDAFIVDAARFVPQSRQRLFLVGIANNIIADPDGDAPACYSLGDCRPSALADFILWHPEVRWHIRSLPSLPFRTLMLKDILEDLPPCSSHWWDRKRAAYLLSQMSEKHRSVAEEMIRSNKQSCGTVFRRVRNGHSMAELRVDGIAGCLRTPRGGSGRQILFVAGKGEYAVRLLTPTECARLMGADDYQIDATLNQALFGFGDAVCVPVIHWISKYYLDPLRKEMHGIQKKKIAVGQSR